MPEETNKYLNKETVLYSVTVDDIYEIADLKGIALDDEIVEDVARHIENGDWGETTCLIADAISEAIQRRNVLILEPK